MLPTYIFFQLLLNANTFVLNISLLDFVLYTNGYFSLIPHCVNRWLVVYQGFTRLLLAFKFSLPVSAV